VHGSRSSERRPWLRIEAPQPIDYRRPPWAQSLCHGTPPRTCLPERRMTESNTVGLGRRRPLGALLLILLAATGCSSLVRVAEYPLRKLAEETEPATRPLTPVALQDQLMRFADRYHSAVIAATAKLRENGRPPDPARLLLMRLRYTE